jgi:hypothetical protein
LTSASALNAAVWRRVGQTVAVPDRSLGLFRWVFGLFLLTLSAPHYAWIDRAPRAFFDPPVLSLSYLFGHFPSRPFFLLLDIVILVSLWCMTIGWHAHAATALVLAGRLVGSSFTYSFGKIDHDIIIDVLLLCMLIAGWGRELSVDSMTKPQAEEAATPSSTSRRTRQGLALFGLLLSFGFLTAGFPKLVSWLDFNLHTSGFLAWALPNRSSLGRTYLLSAWGSRVPVPVLELIDYVGPLLEVSAFVALLAGRRAWRVFLLLACTFHLANALVLNIAFTSQAITYLAFVDLTRISDAAKQFLRRWWRQLAVLAGAAAAWQVASRALESGSSIILITSPEAEAEWILYLSLPCCALVFGLLAVDLALQRPAAASARAPQPLSQ